MTKPNPDMESTYSYTSAGNTGRPVHPMCSAMSMASRHGLYVIGIPAAVESHPVFKTVPSGQTQTVLADAKSIEGPLPQCKKCGGEPMLREEDRGIKGVIRWYQCSRCGDRTPPLKSLKSAIVAWIDGYRLVHSSPAAGESAPTSPEAPQAHGLTTPATPSAAVGASEPVAVDTIPPEVGKRYVCRNGEVTDAMTDDGGPAYPFVTRVHGIHRSWRGDGRHDLSRLSEYDLIEEYHETEPSPKFASHHVCFYCQPGGNQTPDNPRRTDFCWRCGHRGEGIRRDDKQSPPAESPDDWVTQDRVPARVALDEYRVSGSQSEPGVWKRCIYGTFPIVHGYQHGRPLITGTGNSTLELRCRRKDLPVVPAETPAQQPSCSPVCALCGNIATCFGQYADHDKGFACDSCCGHGNEDGWCMTIGEYDHQNSTPSVHSPSLPSPWRPMTERPRVAAKHWLAWDGKQMSVTMNTGCSGWPISGAIAWAPVEPPQHPNAARADKPRMRQVTLREFSLGERSQTVWGELPAFGCVAATGRMFDVEVPE